MRQDASLEKFWVMATFPKIALNPNALRCIFIEKLNTNKSANVGVEKIRLPEKQ